MIDWTKLNNFSFSGIVLLPSHKRGNAKPFNRLIDKLFSLLNDRKSVVQITVFFYTDMQFTITKEK